VGKLSEALRSAAALDAGGRAMLFGEPKDWAAALRHLAPLVGETGPQAIGLGLLRARAFAKLEKHGEAARVAGTALTWLASAASTAAQGGSAAALAAAWAAGAGSGGGVSGRWERGTPRMLMAGLGSASALELGDVDKAKKYYQLVLRADPDQPEVSAKYKALKKLLKGLKNVDDLSQKGYYHRALDALEGCLADMKALQLSSGTFRSTVLLRQCRAMSQIKRHEEALEACDLAVQLREASGGAANLMREALEARADALGRDNDWDEALRDLASANDLAEKGGADEEQRQSLRRRQHEASQAQRLWRERRDHLSTLELPQNLGQLPHDKQCSWIKKQHRKFARKWHPDKYRGNSDRGARKMREVSEAKDSLTKQFRCK